MMSSWPQWIPLRPRRLIAAAALALIASTGCASTKVDHLSTNEFKPIEDEAELWKKADDFDTLVDRLATLYEDEALTEYLNSIAKRLLPHLGAADVPTRIRVIPDQYLNAFAQPNGTIYLHTGIIARAESEAELALVISHELVHYVGRHSLRELRKAQNQRDAAMFGSFLLAVAAGAIVDPGSLASHLANVQTSGYSRKLELEADTQALEAMRLAGYDIYEAPKVFEHLMEQAKAIEQPYYHGSHPKLTVRLAETRELIEQLEADGDPTLSTGEAYRDEYLGAIADLLLENADLSLVAGYRDQALRDAHRHVQARPDSIDAHLLLGRLHKSRISRRHERMPAMDAYREVVRIDPNRPEAHRELGLLLRGVGEHEQARSALRRYLELDNEAVDRPIIEAFIQEIASSSKSIVPDPTPALEGSQ